MRVNEYKLKKQFFDIEDYIKKFLNKDELWRYLALNNTINATDISEHANQPKDIAREIISKLIKSECVIKKHSYYVKTDQFSKWIKSKLNLQ